MIGAPGADEGKARTAPTRHGSADPSPQAPLGVRPVVPGGTRAPSLFAERPVITDSTMTALHASLSGLQQRQRVTADNIANIQTPGFLAGRVDFESTLQSEISNGEVPVVGQGSVTRSMDPTRTDGNNVNLDTETVIQTETGLRYQLAINALDGKYALLRSALRTS